MTLTNAQLKALKILSATSYSNPISAAGFAEKMWPDSNMHTSSKNQGHGATTGKAAWLCGGSYLAKLKKKGWIYICGDYLNRFYISQKGKEAIKAGKPLNN